MIDTNLDLKSMLGTTKTKPLLVGSLRDRTRPELHTTDCYRIQELLKAGESWTRQAWINHPKLMYRHPRIAFVRNHDANSNDEGYQDQFKQIWTGLYGGEPALNIISYRPNDEDWYAADWIKTDVNGVPIGYKLPAWEEPAKLPEEQILNNFNRGVQC